MFRFTIRDVLWLTVVVALWLGWGLDRIALNKAHRETAQKLRDARGWEDRAQALAKILRRDGYTVEVSPNGSSVQRP